MKKRNRGFTLLELMVVLVIAGVLIGVGIPAFRNFIMDARMTSTANDLVAALHYARSEAIKRRTTVVICATEDSLAVSPTCTAPTAPPIPPDADPDVPNVEGWVVFVDSNGDGRFDNPSYIDLDNDGYQDSPAEVDTDGDGELDEDEDLDGDGKFDFVEESDMTEVVIQRGQAVPSTIRANSSADPFIVTFRDTGQITGDQVDVVFCDERGNRSSYGDLSTARLVSISVTGRPSVSRVKGEVAAKINSIGGCE
jgi:prepilin-type N-terminal cleavage/methylation domain-containing protein